MYEKIAETNRPAAATEFNNAAVDFAKRQIYDMSMYFHEKAEECDPDDVTIRENHKIAIKNEKIRIKNVKIDAHNSKVKFQNMLHEKVENGNLLRDSSLYQEAIDC
jgi:hypothetical protein